MRRLVITSSSGPGVKQLRLTGRLGHDTAAEVAQAITKALLSEGRALVDLDELEIEEPSRVMIFPAALAEAGGWPQARLVLCGGTHQTVRLLTSSGVTNTVQHAPTAEAGAKLFAFRPRLVRKRAFLERQPTAPRLARYIVADACEQWRIAVTTAYWAELVISELVTNAIQHAKTSCHLVVEFTGTDLRLSTTDRSDQPPVKQPFDLSADHGRGLQIVSALADQWGVRTGTGHKVTWAIMAATIEHDHASTG